MDNRYVIEEKMLLKLITAYFKLNALEAGGVDNWSWYSESLNDYLRECMPKDLDEDNYWDYGFEGLAEDLLQTFVVYRLNDFHNSQTLINYLSKFNISPLDSNGEFKSTETLLKEISKIWETLTSEEQKTMTSLLLN